VSLVQIRNLKKVYTLGKRQVQALRGLDLILENGEFTVVVGPSGSGKTTLLNMIGCLDSPTSGEVCLQENRISQLRSKQLARIRRDKIGFVFQFFNLIPVFSIFENVEYPLILQKCHKKERMYRVQSLLEQVGLFDYRKHRPNELSGGQQQRVAIARALVSRPLLILADEPTGNLDSQNAAEIIQLMKSLNRQNGTTFIFSTHDPRIMEQASRRIDLRDGQIANEF
jgi:putative ABC transport system ATP-binding protein